MMREPIFREYCLLCAKQYPPDAFRTRCDACGGALDVDYDLARVRIRDNREAPIARYHELLPVQDASNLVHVGAGNTPCVHARELGRKLGMSALYLKDETKNPTGTVKDRPAEVVLSYLKERDVWHITSSATGNSSTAFARATILSPPFEHSIFIGERWLSRLTFEAHERVHVWVLEGRETTTLEAIACSRKWERDNGVPAEGGFFNIGRREGLKLAFLEAVDQVRRPFDWYMQGVSTGMGAYAAFKGALQYQALGLVDRIPKMALVQEATCAPQVQAWREGCDGIRPHHILERPDGIADALLKGNHTETYPYIYRMMTRTGGQFVSVSEEEIRSAQRDLKEAEGISACFSASTTIAALKKLRATEQIGASECVLVMLTGSDRDPRRHVRN
ncbi:MAG: pyridoxal-phosphate dependent enzyme, partial [Myxococcales bacterium]|nr:pyridoxal-phosphate dependent enzyme [Myxococcales bacterium]